MKIGIDGNEANTDKKVGVSVYAFELLSYFKKQSHKNLQFIIYLRDPPLAEMPKESEYFSYRIVDGPALWSQIFFPIYLFLHREIDILFCPAHYAPRFCPVKTVITIHDLAFFYYPNEYLKKDLYQLRSWTKYSIEKASKIITVSKTTAKDVFKFYHIRSDKVAVIYNGYKKESDSRTSISTEVSKLIETPYFLYVGTIQPRKNITRLIEAFSFFVKENPTYKLILVGKKGWLYEEIYKKVGELGLQSSVIFTGFISDQDRNELYKNAVANIFPSLYEGFGLPLLEAMSLRCPVLASKNASLPEIGGNACLYFDPESEKDIKEKMKKILNKNLRKELVQKGEERVKLFSWDRCGKETLEILKNI